MALTAQAHGQLHVLRLDRHALRVDAGEVGVRQHRHDVRLRRLLDRHDRAALEAQALLLRARHLAHQALERRALDQQVRALLELADLADRARARAPAALRPLHARRRARRLLALLRRDAALRAGRLLGAGHGDGDDGEVGWGCMYGSGCAEAVGER